MIALETAEAHLIGDRCHGCGGAKRIGFAFCQGCLNLLPDHMRTRLGGKGERFAEAYEQAGRCIAQRRLTAKEIGAARYARITLRRA